MKKLLLLITILFIFVTPRPLEARFDNKFDLIDELILELDSLQNQFRFPAIAVALISKDSIFKIHLNGYANYENNVPVKDNTLFNIGSCTKSFIGIGFLKLVEDGKVDINMPIKDIIPEISVINPWEDTNPVRIVHLLEHTAGFDDIHPSSLYNIEDPSMPLKQALDKKASLRKVRWQPGTRKSYSSIGFTVAGYILEKITKQSYETFLDSILLSPLSMNNSSLLWATTETGTSIATGYNEKQQPLPLIIGYDRPAGLMFSTVQDMAIFVQFLINGGTLTGKTILKESSINELGKPKTTLASREGLENGYSYGMSASFNNGFKWLGHSGGGPGTIARFAYLPEFKLGYVILANKFNHEKFTIIKNRIEQFLIKDIKNSDIISNQIVDTSKLNEYSGYYELHNSRQELTKFMDIIFFGKTITLKNDTLYQQEFQGAPQALIPVKDNLFRKIKDPTASIAFTMDESGVQVMTTSEQYFEKSSTWKPYLYRVLLFSALIIMASALVYVLVWILVLLIRLVLKKKIQSKYTGNLIFSILAIIFLVVGTYVVSTQPLITIGLKTIENIFFFVSTILFGSLSVLSTYYSLRSINKPVHPISKIYSILLSASCLGMTFFLWFYGFIGLRLWVY